jgi:hypothetical protein
VLANVPGSNGGVHCGPDLKPRVNVCQGTWMKALMKEAPLVTYDSKGRRRRSRSKEMAAMVENLATRLVEITISGSDADVLRLAMVMSQVFPQPKNGKNDHSSDRPIMPNFTRAEPAATEGPATPPPPGSKSAARSTHDGVSHCQCSSSVTGIVSIWGFFRRPVFEERKMAPGQRMESIGELNDRDSIRSH